MSKTEVVLGVDIGGTNTAFAFVDERGNCNQQTSIKTQSDLSAEDFMRRLVSRVKPLMKGSDTEFVLRGIGIGAPNGNIYSGCIENPPNLGWKNTNIVELFRKYFDVPVKLTNDANAAALGEMQFGAARGMKNFIEITLGTGLGSGIVVNGEVIYGSDGHAGEMGHVIVEPGGRLCTCGREGCLETYASARGIVFTVQEWLAEKKQSSSLRELAADQLTAKMIADAAAEGDGLALQAFRFTADILGRALANAVAFFSPEAIILFGGLAQAGALLFDPLRKSYEQNVLDIYKGKVKIISSGLPAGKAAILGTAALIWHEGKDLL